MPIKQEQDRRIIKNCLTNLALAYKNNLLGKYKIIVRESEYNITVDVSFLTFAPADIVMIDL